MIIFLMACISGVQSTAKNKTLFLKQGLLILGDFLCAFQNPVSIVEQIIFRTTDS